MRAGFFQEDNGNRSWMRFAGQQILGVALFIAIYATITRQLDINSMAFVISLITIALGGKVAQKAFEVKPPENQEGAPAQ